jgi:ectoine hydroxylase-related dioxygenase (phytanoyl-CoA dioxygenase family)
LFRNFDEWVQTQPPGRNPRVPDLTGFHIKKIPAQAGDFIVWHRLLAHGNGHNVSDKPRLAQYITMSPAREDNEELRQQRIHLWQNRLNPPHKAFPGDPRRWEQLHGQTAELTPLGRKLLGLDMWAGDA